MNSFSDRLLDVRGMIIPVTFLKISQTLREIDQGETVDVIGSDPETRKDLVKILKVFSCELLKIEDGKSDYLIRLRKIDQRPR